jgi:hypothetical protein
VPGLLVGVVLSVELLGVLVGDDVVDGEVEVVELEPP